MPDLHLPSGVGLVSSMLGQNSNNPWLISCSGGAANVKGSWVELVASTPFATDAILLSPNYSDGNYSYLIDIGMGAAGSEVAFLNNLYFWQGSSYSKSGNPIIIPFHIPAGVRLAMRCQSSGASSAVRFGILLLGGSLYKMAPHQNIYTYGANLSTTRGTAITAGANYNTKGSWVAVCSSLDIAIKGFFLAFGNGPTTGTQDYLIDIAVGGAGSEQILINNYIQSSSPGISYNFAHNLSPFFPIPLPAGSRIALRTQSNFGFDAALYAVG